MFTILDGRADFYQWDTNRKLVVEDDSITEVHFCNKTSDCSLVCETYSIDGITLVDVPNVLLQSDWKIRVYAYVGYTKYEECFKVIARTKPADYVYTETEIKRYEDLEKRIENLEMGGGADVDLTNYYTKEEIDTLTTGFITEEEVDKKLEDIGGGGEADLELIVSVTTTEDVKKVEIRKDSNDEKINLKKAFIEITYPATEVTGTVQTCVHCNENYCVVAYSKAHNLNTTKAQYTTVYCEHLGNNIYSFSSTNMGNLQTEYFSIAPSDALIRKEQGQNAIKWVLVSGYTALNIPAGTVINVYGVRA